MGAHGPRWVWGWGRGQRSTIVPSWSWGSAAEHLGKGRVICTGDARDPGSLFPLASLGLAGSEGISPDSEVQVTQEGGALPQMVGRSMQWQWMAHRGRQRHLSEAEGKGWIPRLSLGDESGERPALGGGGGGGQRPHP